VRPPAIEGAPRSRRGYLEARPIDLLGKNLLVVDIRPEVDLCGDFGHIRGALHLSAEAIEGEGLRGIPPDAPVVLVCNNGRKSADAAETLVERHRYHEVYVLVGGMVRWCAEERPVAHEKTWRRVGP